MNIRNPLFCLLLLAACSADESGSKSEAELPISPVDVAAPTAAQLAAFSSASNAFALDLYAEARKAGGNLAFSPASIELALGMAWAGARGETAIEMQRVLRIESTPEELHEAAGRILAAWNDPKRTTYELRVANRLFGEKSYSFEAAYLELVRSRYRAPLATVDFRGAPGAQRERINTWVEKQTENRIQDLLPPNSVSADTRLILVNAVYFLGKWTHEFDEEFTDDQTFYLQDGSKATVQTMYQKEEHSYAEVDGVQVLQMPYHGGDLAMMLVLPKARDGLPAVESTLDTARIKGWVDALRTHEVRVYVPSFEIRNARLPLTEILATMGMKLAFADAADFSGIGKNLKFSDVIHEAFIKVDESGTEAAAATAVVMEVASAMPGDKPPIPVFRADHPFLFFIRDLDSGTILFMGRVAHPSA